VLASQQQEADISFKYMRGELLQAIIIQDSEMKFDPIVNHAVAPC
jgi:hypothetical protein